MKKILLIAFYVVAICWPIVETIIYKNPKFLVVHGLLALLIVLGIHLVLSKLDEKTK